MGHISTAKLFCVFLFLFFVTRIEQAVDLCATAPINVPLIESRVSAIKTLMTEFRDQARPLIYAEVLRPNRGVTDKIQDITTGLNAFTVITAKAGVLVDFSQIAVPTAAFLTSMAANLVATKKQKSSDTVTFGITTTKSMLKTFYAKGLQQLAPLMILTEAKLKTYTENKNQVVPFPQRCVIHQVRNIYNSLNVTTTSLDSSLSKLIAYINSWQ